MSWYIDAPADVGGTGADTLAESEPATAAPTEAPMTAPITANRTEQTTVSAPNCRVCEIDSIEYVKLIQSKPVASLIDFGESDSLKERSVRHGLESHFQITCCR